MNISTTFRSIPPDIDKLLVFCSENDCSDLFITVGQPPMMYRYGMLYQGGAAITEVSWNNFSRAITSQIDALYAVNRMADFSYSVGKYRYRVNVGYSLDNNIATFRMISNKLPSFESLRLDKNVISLLERAFAEKQGITMLVGATGSGKTSTLAACINSFSSGYRDNKNLPLQDANLITLEDPVEYLYPTLPRTRVTQKELGKDFASFDLGIKAALREHPTHVLVGETRDKETIRALVNCSRTGHSCITTYHTSSVSDTVSRLYSYLADENKEIMYDLVANLNFILCQRLLKGRNSYTLEYQYMFFVPEVKRVLSNAIYENKHIPFVIDNLMSNEVLIKNKLCSGWARNR